MKQVVKYFLFVLLLSTNACIEECGACFTPPKHFVFEIVDKTTRENLFTNGTYQQSQIEAINTFDNSAIEFSFISEDSLNLIVIYSIGWKTEKVNFLIKIADNDIFNLYVDAERLSEDCCSFTRYHEVRIDNAEYELNPENEIYTILVE